MADFTITRVDALAAAIDLFQGAKTAEDFDQVQADAIVQTLTKMRTFFAKSKGADAKAAVRQERVEKVKRIVGKMPDEPVDLYFVSRVSGIAKSKLPAIAKVGEEEGLIHRQTIKGLVHWVKGADPTA